VAALEAAGLFAGATRPLLERLAGEAKEVAFDSGDTIVQEREPADAVYVLTEGHVLVSAVGEGSSERPIRVLLAPAFFGEIGVLEQIPRTASVTAVSGCRCLRIAAETVLSAFTSTPPSSSVMENARTRLALTHPSRRLTFEPTVAGSEA
jgi:CRP-like cAMP-binding protein